jgi:hypothetical protein
MEVQNHNVLHNNAFFNVIETAVMLSKTSVDQRKRPLPTI